MKIQINTNKFSESTNTIKVNDSFTELLFYELLLLSYDAMMLQHV